MNIKRTFRAITMKNIKSKQIKIKQIIIHTYEVLYEATGQQQQVMGHYLEQIFKTQDYFITLSKKVLDYELFRNWGCLQFHLHSIDFSILLSLVSNILMQLSLCLNKSLITEMTQKMIYELVYCSIKDYNRFKSQISKTQHLVLIMKIDKLLFVPFGQNELNLNSSLSIAILKQPIKKNTHLPLNHSLFNPIQNDKSQSILR